jgi:hypothetical protein
MRKYEGHQIKVYDMSKQADINQINILLATNILNALEIDIVDLVSCGKLLVVIYIKTSKAHG